MPIHQKDFPIFLALMQNPIGNDAEITEIANKILSSSQPTKQFSLTTIHRRIKKMEEQQFLQGVAAYVDYNLLGLEQHIFIIEIEAIDWENNITIMEKYCDLHPYTYFRDRIFGAVDGLICYFTIPDNEKAEILVLKGLNKFKDKKIISKYKHYKMDFRKYYPGSLEKYKLQTGSWEINFDSISEIMKKKSNNFQFPIVKKENILEKLSIYDLAIIREMTRNARRSQNDILEELFNGESVIGQEYIKYVGDFPESKQSFSRRLKFLNDRQIFTEYRLHFDLEDFGMFNHILYIFDFESNKLNNLIEIIENGTLPFPCGISASNEKIVVWINLPPNTFTKLTNIILNNFKNVQIFIFGYNLTRYLPWHENLDIKKHEWKSSEEWMISNPMESLNLD
ncbi:MAG: hypothetical protein HeimC2_12080 [Candidatus Heimdallarchaeota archaeon LC_2]|nr:MAG: hypothetical protein HeimC2_12080 [Candidatus Heimdallarchaeota archaeon LC_2]